MINQILFDSHCHLQDERIAAHLDDVMRRAADAGVRRMLCCGTCQHDWLDVLEISKTYHGVVPAFGVHPWYLEKKDSDWLDVLEQLLIDNPGAAVGEIGLDHAVDPRNDELQNEVFIAQLRLARKYNRPLSLHCRKAWKTLADILSAEGGVPDGGVIHSYSGPPDLVLPLSRLGCSFSFSGSITQPLNKRGIASLGVVPAERLLIETDSPDILPNGAPSEINEPGNLVLIADAVARITGLASGELCELTYDNSVRMFERHSCKSPTELPSLP